MPGFLNEHASERMLQEENKAGPLANTRRGTKVTFPCFSTWANFTKGEPSPIPCLVFNRVPAVQLLSLIDAVIAGVDAVAIDAAWMTVLPPGFFLVDPLLLRQQARPTLAPGARNFRMSTCACLFWGGISAIACQVSHRPIRRDHHCRP